MKLLPRVHERTKQIETPLRTYQVCTYFRREDEILKSSKKHDRFVGTKVFSQWFVFYETCTSIRIGLLFFRPGVVFSFLFRRITCIPLSPSASAHPSSQGRRWISQNILTQNRRATLNKCEQCTRRTVGNTR